MAEARDPELNAAGSGAEARPSAEFAGNLATGSDPTRGPREREFRKLPTGVPGLDDVLGGGLPEFSFNLVAGSPGAGKTTLVLQFLFANVSPESPALFFTVLGEPTLKLLRHQQQFPFFDPKCIGRDLHFVHLGAELESGDLEAVLTRIVDEVARIKPRFVVVDSFRSMVRAALASGVPHIEQFVQRLAMHLTTWEVTSFLVGEHGDGEWNNPVFTVADGIIWLSQAVDRNSVVRKLQVIKVRGQASMPGLHTFRISSNGLHVFPRMRQEPLLSTPRPVGQRLSTGIPGLDEMTEGGIPVGDVVLVAGPTGSGKTTFAMQFALEGLKRGESVVVAGFEEYPREYFAKAEALGGDDFRRAVSEGRFKVVYLRSLDLSVDETMQELRDTVESLQATRVIIDSLAGFEVALAPTFRQDFRESLHRLVRVITSIGVTVMLTNEVAETYSEQRFTVYGVSFMCDDIILNRYIEIEGTYRRVVAIVKMRGGRHSREMRLFEIGHGGIQIGEALSDYRGIITGVPLYEPRRRPEHHGLVAREALVARRLASVGECTFEVLAADTQLAPQELETTLQRLVDVGYAASSRRDGVTMWVALARVTP